MTDHHISILPRDRDEHIELPATSLALTSESTEIDVTDVKSAGQWREILGGAGVKSCAINARPVQAHPL